MNLVVEINEIKNIMKASRSLENRRTLLKGTTRKITDQKGEFLNYFRPLMTAGLQLIKIALTSLAKSVLIQLGLTTPASATKYKYFQKKMFGLGMTVLIISNKEMEDVIKIDKSFEEFGSLIKGISQRFKNEAKKKKGGFLDKLLDRLAEGLLGNILAGKEV